MRSGSEAYSYRYADVRDQIQDGDVLLYRFAWANQKAIRWDEDTTSTLMGTFAQARDGDADLAVLVTDLCPSAARLRELRVLAELLGLA